MAARTAEQLRHHYEVEKELADRLRRASGAERLKLYSAVYNELFQRVPDHSQLTRKKTPEQQREMVNDQLDLLRKFLTRETTYLEIGAGDCAVTVAAAGLAKKAIAIDVSPEIAKPQGAPANMELIISDGLHVPVPDGSITLAYSNQLMEHLHPDDAMEQLRNILKALAPGGRYVCITPNRVTGPHDVSKHFDATATGFHLKEYTVRELARIFRQVGFAKMTSYARLKGVYLRCPLWIMTTIESLIAAMPRKVKSMSAVQGFLGLVLVGQKPR